MMHGHLVCGTSRWLFLRSESVLPVPKKKGGEREKTALALGQKMDVRTLNPKECIQTVGAAYPLIHLCPFVPVRASIVSLCFISPVFNSLSVFLLLCSLGFFLAPTYILPLLLLWQIHTSLSRSNITFNFTLKHWLFRLTNGGEYQGWSNHRTLIFEWRLSAHTLSIL